MVFDKIKDLLGGGKGGDLGDLPLGGYEKYLEGVTYPIGVDDLLEVLQNNGAPAKLVDMVKSVGQKGKSTFSSQDELISNLGDSGLTDNLKNVI
jgi:hypothetical protein